MERIIEYLQNNGFQLIDYIVIAVYFIIVMGVGLYVGGNPKTARGYFFGANEEEDDEDIQYLN